jgi:hypothetical protein
MVHHLALEHGDGVGGGLLDQKLGCSSGVDGLQDFHLPRLLLGGLLVLLLLLGHDPTGSASLIPPPFPSCP